MIFIIMGVSGSGKSTVGRILADKLDCKFYDADDYHPRENIEKMSKGIPLNDADRKPWLISLKTLIENQSDKAVLACSALKQSYRDILDLPDKNIVFIYLKGDKDLIKERLSGRESHYAGVDLLDSQFDVLEEPEGALTFNIVSSPEDIVQGILKQVDL